jgi:hypothetical protein
MSIKRPIISDDSYEVYGKIISEGMGADGEYHIALGIQPQYGIVNFSKSYIRNPYWYGTSNISLYKLVYDSGDACYMFSDVDNISSLKTVSSFSKFIVFGDLRTTTGVGSPYDVSYNDNCSTYGINSFQANITTADLDIFDSIKILSNVGIDKNTINIGQDLYVLASETEDIHADICGIIRGDGVTITAKEPHGESGTLFNVIGEGTTITDISEEKGAAEKSYFLIGDTTIFSPTIEAVEPIVFVGNGTDGVILKESSSYTFYIGEEDYDYDEESTKMYLYFNESLTDDELAQLTVVLVRAQMPDVTIKYPGGFDEDGVYIKHKNFPYAKMELNYRIY